MRSIGRLSNEDLATTFSEVLDGHGISNSIKSTSAGDWEVWVDSEDQLEEAGQLLGLFEENPEHPDFGAAMREARRRRKVAKEAKKHDRHKVMDRRAVWPTMDRASFGRLTLALIVISVVVGLASQLGEDLTHIRLLLISEYIGGFLLEVTSGQVWRLVTPMFIHFGVLHLLFNMLWLKDLGGMIERVHGTLKLALMVLAISAAANLAQYLMAGPRFGGMSGVVYGLLGYIWIRGKMDPGCGLFLHKSTWLMMLIWYGACWTGLMGPIANWAHTAGLLMGLAWGAAAAKIARR